MWQGPPEDEIEEKVDRTFVLNYFNIGGRAEAIRLTFAAVEQDWMDVQWDMAPDFNHDNMVADREKNPDGYPYGQLPTLEVDGKLIAQSHAIERYLAEEFGLLGKNDVEAALIDAAGEHINDLFSSFFAIIFSGSDAEKFKKHYSEYLPGKLGPLENHVQQSGSGWIIGDRLSLADIQFYYYVQSCNHQAPLAGVLAKFPGLEALKAKFEAVPGIEKYLKARPHTWDQDMFQDVSADAAPERPEKFTLNYFDLRARAECARCILAAAQQEYQDNRWPIEAGTFKHDEMEADKKENPQNYPFGQLPVLDVDGTKIAQSHTIERYLAETLGFMGSNDIETALIDAAGEHARDIGDKWTTIIFSSSGDEEKGKPLRNITEVISRIRCKFSRIKFRVMVEMVI
eukprot:TRINITY_DN1403_c0_g1_i1.p1 TRINITY_DN1403_c0_g1~~TRINITY_DN1403_c0_g1_i1.p1  ORF type:complete len:399 (+),score=107.66 TRINITY_DN1403_c0_g1_i1:471-1667(+)